VVIGRAKGKGSFGEEGNMTRSGQMDTCVKEVLEVVQEFPGNAREIWNRAFRKALLEVNGDMRRATTMAWQAFKRQEARDGSVRDREKAEKGVLLVAVHGETPEWIRLVRNEEIISDKARCPCLVDRRALAALVAKWEQWDEDLVILLEDYKVDDQPAPIVGWIKEMKRRTDGLWIRVEWTEEGLGYITRKEFGYLGLGFILDKSNRPVELWQARLTNYPLLNRWEEVLWYLRGRQESQTEAGRRLRLIKDVDRRDINGGRENRRESKPEMAAKGKVIYEGKKFLDEMKGLLRIHGDVSFEKVKRAIVELKTQEEINQALGSEQEMVELLQEVIGKTVEEAIKKGLIKPEQRTWAEVYATRDWSGFHEFLSFVAAASQKKTRLFPYCRSLLRWALAKPQETGSINYKTGCSYLSK
jgi:phage I-like protein